MYVIFMLWFDGLQKLLRKFEDFFGIELGCILGVIMGYFIGILGDIFDCFIWFNLNFD